MSGNDGSEPPEQPTEGQRDGTTSRSTESTREEPIAADGFTEAEPSSREEDSDDGATDSTTDLDDSSATPDDLREELEDVSASELTVPPQSLHPKVRIVWVVQSLLSAALFGAIVGAIDIGVTGIGLWVGPAVFGVFALIGVLHAVLRYRVWEYEVREDALYLERGVVTRVRTVVPYVRIQHVDASRGPVERAIGLASAVVYTAGSRGADVTIPGLTADGADDLQNRLKRMAILAEGDDAV